MNQRREWADLPEQVRLAVRERCGSEVLKAEPPEAGRNSDFAAVLHLLDSKVFCKGVAAKNPAIETQRAEAAVNPFLSARAPRLLWTVEEAGWLFLGFEYVPGRHADLSPGSPDLNLVADCVSALARDLTPCPADVPALTEKMTRMSAWRRLAHDPPAGLDAWALGNLDRFAELEPSMIAHVAGNTLAHTDLHSLNLLVGDRLCWAIDWAWAHTSAVWVDAACLVIRLIEAGHSPDDAEQWAATVPGWLDAPPAAVNAFAVELFGMWEYLRHARPLPARTNATRAAAQWAQHRLATSALNI